MARKEIPTLYIQQHPVGSGQPVFIIAEAGVNHNGQLKLALELIDAAKDAGADCVKFQTFQGADIVTKAGKMAPYQEKNLGVKKSQKEMLEELALPEQFYPKIIARCKKRKIIFMSTPHGGFGSVHFLEQFEIPAYKLGSGDLTNLPLLTYIASLGKPLIISTGMATVIEISDAVDAIECTGNRQLAILHCTSNYPCALKDVHLAAMQTMMKKFTYPIGYSDHTAISQVPTYAALFGATVIEKHITTDRNLPGPDQINSLEPNEFKNMVEMVRKVEKLTLKERENASTQIPSIILGSSIKQPNQLEKEIALQVRKSLVYTKDLPRGQVLGRGDVEIKRPGLGLAPKLLYNTLGRRLKHSVSADTLVNPLDFV